jgi:isopentenyl-diphosphate delta-isomerase
VGSGISADVAIRLRDAGVEAVDVAGRGGTSWYAVEARRAASKGKPADAAFSDWGIPTEEALVAVHTAVPDLQIVASGGIRTGLDIAKALALGADVGAFGQPLLASALDSAGAVVGLLSGIIHEIKVAMLCVGAVNLAELKKRTLVRRSA